jgi:formylglycine-generating enzyme required for sulfatase activity
MNTTLTEILEKEKLEHLLPLFVEQGVDDSILSALTDSDLREIGIQKLGERKRLLSIFSGAVTGTVPQTTTADKMVAPGANHPAEVRQHANYSPSGSSEDATSEYPHVNSLGMPFVRIPRFDTLFCIYPVRVQDYETYCMATGANFPRSAFAQELDHPMVNVSWFSAIKFCAWLTGKEREEGKIDAHMVYRLPTDMEWSAAVGLPHEPEATPAERSGKIPSYPWGLRWPPPKGAGNFHSDLNVDSFEHTSPVGSFPANACGLYDMGGNVWEWCMVRYGPRRTERVLRGASWSDSNPEYLLSSYRYTPSHDRDGNIGFRCVFALEKLQEQYSVAAPSKSSATPAEATKDSPWVNSLGMPFVPIPRFDTLFCIWPVRVQDYEAYCMATDAELTRCEFPQELDHPMVNVSWDDAIKFCAWLTGKEREEGKIGAKSEYRLPTDMEWSAAVGLPHEPEATPAERSEKIPGYPWGLQWPPPKGAGNYFMDLEVDFVYTSPVGSFPANAYGIYDMGGNVWEWCMDWYDSDQYERVLRGASWLDNSPENLLSSDRDYNNPDVRNDCCGFRCVLVGESSR